MLDPVLPSPARKCREQSDPGQRRNETKEMLRYLTAGESHGKGLVAVIEGIPAGLPLAAEDINHQLARRQAGYGRGGRMAIERDQVEILSGVRLGLTMGSPIALYIPNLDWSNWKETMAVEAAPPPKDGTGGQAPEPVTRPRPGHADLPGALKYGERDLRNVLERASARETAARVAVGAVARRLLREFGVEVYGHVLAIGSAGWRAEGVDPAELGRQAEESPVRCANQGTEREILRVIQQARKEGDSVGGVFEVLVTGVVPGLGSHVHWDRKLDGRLAAAVMSIQGIKGIEIGAGFLAAREPGSVVHDEIRYSPEKGFWRPTNNAGGIEGGITNGETVVVRAAMKPIPTLYRPLGSVDLVTKEPFAAGVHRSDVCAVPAACVVGEAVVAFEIARAMTEKFGADSLDEMKRNWCAYRETILQGGSTD